jgi:hypothetical protein
MQIIICAETTGPCNSDYLYISSFIRAHYCLDNPTPKLTPVYLKGKTHYQSKETEILSDKKKYRASGNSVVIMCFDTDQGSQGEKDNKAISDYCSSHGYDLVWMNRDVEEVFLGHSVSQATAVKKKEAEKFGRSNAVSLS